MVAEKAGIMVHRFIWDYLDANTYVIETEMGLLIIDPTDSKAFWQLLDEKTTKTVNVILTHEHFDHINGLNRLRERGVCTVYAHERCSENIGSPGRNLSNIAEVIAQFGGILIPKGKKVPLYVCEPADAVFEGSLEFDWYGNKVQLFHTPGHSAGSICILLNGKILFSGDTIMNIPVITRFPGGSTEQYTQITVPKLKALIGQIEYVFPGHGDGGSLEDMLRKNGI